MLNYVFKNKQKGAIGMTLDLILFLTDKRTSAIERSIFQYFVLKLSEGNKGPFKFADICKDLDYHERNIKTTLNSLCRFGLLVENPKKEYSTVDNLFLLKQTELPEQYETKSNCPEIPDSSKVKEAKKPKKNKRAEKNKKAPEDVQEAFKLFQEAFDKHAHVKKGKLTEINAEVNKVITEILRLYTMDQLPALFKGFFMKRKELNNDAFHIRYILRYDTLYYDTGKASTKSDKKIGSIADWVNYQEKLKACLDNPLSTKSEHFDFNIEHQYKNYDWSRIPQDIKEKHHHKNGTKYKFESQTKEVEPINNVIGGLFE
jgi:hypothetical protein